MATAQAPMTCHPTKSGATCIAASLRGSTTSCLRARPARRSPEPAQGLRDRGPLGIWATCTASPRTA
eukprot:5387778-Alexandrium_andersonii.AAC.1